MSLDTLLQPDNDDSKTGKQKSDESTKSRLNSLKEMLKADPVQIDTDKLLINPGDFPASQQAAYIDYAAEKKNHNEFAAQAITNIILTYVKSPDLLDSPRLKDLKQKDIIKYAQMLLLVQISEANLIRLQESIDGGDMSKEMFDSVEKAQNRMVQNMEAMDKHLVQCEKYWSTYAANYGLESTEEKIVQESAVKEDTVKKHTIIDLSKLTELIHSKVDEKKKTDTKNEADKRDAESAK